MGKGLYIGKEFDPKSGTLGARVELEPSDLVTHGLIVGMTGSGKTGLAVALIEELLLQGVPVLAIDPKGDLGNLLLLFQGLDAPSFAPWIDPDAARREGKDLQAAAADAAAQWKKGLADWGLGPAEMAELALAREAVIFTPGSEAGVPLNILQSLDPPAVPVRLRGRGPARRDRRLRDRPPRPRGHRRRPAAVERVHPAHAAHRERMAGRARRQPGVADSGGGRPAVRKDGRASPGDRLPAQGAPEPHDGAQQPARLAGVRGLEGGRAAGRGAAAARRRRPPAAVDRLHRAPVRSRAAVRDRPHPEQGEDVGAPAERDFDAAGGRVHRRDLRLLPARTPRTRRPSARC